MNKRRTSDKRGTLYFEDRIIIGGSVYGMECKFDVRGAPHFGLEAMHYACPFCRPEETNYSSFYLYDFFNSNGCDKGDGDTAKDDSFLILGIELPDDESVFTGDLSDFFDQGNTEVVTDETNSHWGQECIYPGFTW